MFYLPSFGSKNKRSDLDSILPLTNKLEGNQTSIFGYIYDTSASIGTAITGSCQVYDDNVTLFKSSM